MEVWSIAWAGWNTHLFPLVPLLSRRTGNTAGPVPDAAASAHAARLDIAAVPKRTSHSTDVRVWVPVICLGRIRLLAALALLGCLVPVWPALVNLGARFADLVLGYFLARTNAFFPHRIPERLVGVSVRACITL